MQTTRVRMNPGLLARLRCITTVGRYGHVRTLAAWFLAALIIGVVPSYLLAGATYDAVGVEAIDGDSVFVRFPSGLQVEVRLVSIDCPEHGQAFSEKAKAFTDRQIKGKALRVLTGEQERDRHNRLLAFVEIDGSRLNTALVKAGLAVVWVIPPNTTGVDELLAAQRSAHDDRRGIWGPGGPGLEPRAYRVWDKGSSAPGRSLRYENHLVIGNQRSRVAHWPGCRHVEEMSPGNVRYFSSVAEAQSAGYRMEKGQR